MRKIKNVFCRMPDRLDELYNWCSLSMKIFSKNSAVYLAKQPINIHISYGLTDGNVRFKNRFPTNKCLLFFLMLHFYTLFWKLILWYDKTQRVIIVRVLQKLHYIFFNMEGLAFGLLIIMNPKVSWLGSTNLQYIKYSTNYFNLQNV